MNVRIFIILILPFMATADQMFLLRSRPNNNYLRSPSQTFGYSSPLIVNPHTTMDSEHRPLQLPSNLRDIIRDPLELAGSRHLPRFLLKPRHLDDVPRKEPLYYYVASPPAKHKDPPFLTSRNFPAVTHALMPRTKFVPSALKRDFLMEDEMPLTMAEDTSFPIYSARKKPLTHLINSHVYDDFDQSSEQSGASLFIQPRPIIKDRSPLIMRSMEPRLHSFSRYYDIDPSFNEYQRQRPYWGHRREPEESQYDDQLEAVENENKSQQNGEKKKKKKKRKKNKKTMNQQELQEKKIDKEWMSVPEIMTSEEINSKSNNNYDFARRSATSDEVDWTNLHKDDILRIDNHRNLTNIN